MPALTKAQKKQAQAAEESFQRTYAAQYGQERWQEILYPTLMAPVRYALLINRFVVAGIPKTFSEDEVRGLQSLTFPSHAESSSGSLLISYQSSAPDAQTTFPSPQIDPSRRLMTHWNLDGASLLAVTVLGPKPGDKVLDLCAAPGGKSVALSQLLRPESFDDASPSLAGGCLHSNEVNNARNQRLDSNLQSYLPEPLFKNGEVKVLQLDGTEANTVQMLPLGPGGYDKVLLDAPCSSERHVIHAHSKAKQGGRAANELAFWRPGQSRKAAKTQAALLLTALRAVRMGGNVLYVTCSLSDDENDGVIDKGIELVQKERKKLGIKWDLAVRSGALPGKDLEQWAERTKHGWIVLPDHQEGGRWGPLFFSLLEKVPV
ncbi:S-adenosyl-L-methionine-dependent methyltransferase [Xylariaceae sp. FL0662B]|nr:S-adenosyl-L-methionine-dependent methyltransferase [Xylariaceae sp. FL0662B]